MDELLAQIEPGAMLHLELRGGGAVEGEYVEHDGATVTIRLGGERRAYGRAEIADATILVINRA